MKGTASDKICDAMLALLEEKSLDRISVKELTALAGVNRSSYSYHFYCKDDVIDAIYNRFNSGLGTIFFKCFTKGESGAAIYTNIKKTVLNYYWEHRKEVQILWAAGYDGQFTRKFVLALEELFHQLEYTVIGEDETEVRISSGSEYEMRIKQMVHSILAAIEYWELYRYAISLDEVVSLSNKAESLKIQLISFKSRTGKTHIG